MEHVALSRRNTRAVGWLTVMVSVMALPTVGDHCRTIPQVSTFA